MTSSKSKVPNYPKSHLLAASGVAALLSLALLVFPSREVEAKKTFLDLRLDNPAEFHEPSQPHEPLSATDSPFAQIQPSSPDDDVVDEPEAIVEADPLSKELTVANGDTLSTVFAKVGLPSKTVHEVLSSSEEAQQLSRLKVGQSLVFQLTDQGELASLHSPISKLESIRVDRSEDNSYVFKKEQITPEVSTAYAHGEIESSLFLAAIRAGLSHNLTMDLASVFGYDIDFAMDIRTGDTFEVIYEEKIVDGERVGTGNILAARFTNRGKPFTAIRYTNKQ